MRRTGNAAVIGVGLLLVVGAVVMVPDIAADVVPASFLPHLPQFEQVETDRNCALVEQGAELVAEIGPDTSAADAKQLFCADTCELQHQGTAATYCSGSGENRTLTCVCRTR